MISFPLAFALIPYGIVLLFFIIFSLINITHLIRYGATTGVSLFMTFIFLAGAVIILFVSWQILGTINWGQPIVFSLPGFR